MKTLSTAGFNKFIPIGDNIKHSELLSKITFQTEAKPETFWATLGWSDDHPFSYDGTLEFSENGNLSSKGITRILVEELKKINENPDVVIRERFINFDHTTLDQEKTFETEKKKKLRFTLFLNPDEAALVYIQHSIKQNYDDEYADIEFILPQKTDNNFSTDRDRLDYYIDVIPKNSLIKSKSLTNKFEQSNEPNDSSFILKVLTYNRGTGSGKELYNKAISIINKQSIFDRVENQIASKVGKKKYDLLLFNPTKNDEENPSFKGKFESIDSFDSLDPSARTLFLIHGTFSSTNNTFSHFLVGKTNEKSFLQHVLDLNYYQQIIAFDHPTISHDVQQNVAYLIRNYLTNENFAQTHIDVIACSRGCILTQALSNDPTLNGLISLNKIMMFSAANGVNYFSFAENIPKFLSIWGKTVSGPFLKVILTLAQFSSEFFLQMPGAEQMTPKHLKLTSILQRTPFSPNTKFISVTSDWTFNIARGTIFKRSGAYLLDRTISLILGKEHDWVVGLESQKLLPKDAILEQKIHLDSMHTKYLDSEYTLPHNVHDTIIKVLTPSNSNHPLS